MNRQRRMEAIARKRAFIDSQIQMLSSTETRVPNIIRNRTGRSLSSNKATAPNFQAVEYLKNKQFVPTASQGALAHGSGHQSSQVAVSQSFSVSQSSSPSTEDVYVAVLESGGGDHAGGGQGHATFRFEGAFNQAGGGVPITLTEEIAKLLSGGTDQFETIKTPDGTVMVVLDGNNFVESETEVAGSINADSAIGDEGKDSVVDVPPEITHQEDVSVEEPMNEEVTTEYEESYVIVQTPDGDVLVPSSNLCTQFQTQSVSSEESIVQFIATESGAIEQFISEPSSKRNPPANKRISHTIAKQNKPPRINSTLVGNNLKRPASVKNVGAAVNKHSEPSSKIKALNQKGTNHKLVHSIMQPNVTSVSGEVTSVGPPTISIKEEKPRPFRFELPELDDYFSDLDDRFMSVPVPINIDSLRNQTENGKNEATTKSQISLSPFPAVVASTEEDSIRNEFQIADTNSGEKEKEGVSDGSLSAEDSKFPKGIQTLVFECQQCNEQFSSEATFLSHCDKHSKQNDSCSVIIQCDQCLGIFHEESSFSDHLEHCEIQSKNNNNNVDKDVSLTTNDVVEQLHFNVSSTSTVEDDFFVKSVNSLSVPVNSSTLPSGRMEETQGDVSSPVNFTEHVLSSIPVSEQHASPLIFVSSNDFTPKNEGLVRFCVQLVDDNSKTNEPPAKQTKLSTNFSADGCLNPSNEVVAESPSSETALQVKESVVDVGRRTLNKASAKASMSTEVGGEAEEWDSRESNDIASDLPPSDQPDGNGNAVTIQSARIRSRNDRIKAMDKNETNEEELGSSFRNIFEQVAMQSITFN